MPPRWRWLLAQKEGHDQGHQQERHALLQTGGDAALFDDGVGQVHVVQEGSLDSLRARPANRFVRSLVDDLAWEGSP